MATFREVPTTDDLMDLDQVITYLKMRPGSVRRFVREGRLQPTRWAGRYRLLTFRRSEVDKLLLPSGGAA